MRVWRAVCVACWGTAEEETIVRAEGYDCYEGVCEGLERGPRVELEMLGYV